MNSPNFNIAAVERETGLSKDVLRVWERRYGFPSPERDSTGERQYSAEQVDRLCQIKRLMDRGHRPGKLIALPTEELAVLAPRHATPAGEPAASADTDDLAALIELIRRHDATGFTQAMQQRVARQGLQRFVQDTIAPLSWQIGQAWESGRIEVFEEHLFTELSKRLLRQNIAALPAGRGHPRILLTTVPEEQHVLGLLMAEALFCLEGAECIPLGTQMPLMEIVRASEAHAADIVALSFSSAFPARQVAPLLQQLRAMLPAEVSLWAGGAGVQRSAAIPGVSLLLTLEDALQALHGRQQMGV
ncbi:MerR family transcriptional regulator [uncultured Azonexus sp.]|uniref:MerR family transcriptional regulator n=1 Tax=uncultured Azonexus sp. TaxID=520307 RepID=UPI002601B38F|nr:MerR family transcriptional regulator [uncultured Azonexus sp.]